jgi:LacI family transcriptional regulator
LITVIEVAHRPSIKFFRIGARRRRKTGDRNLRLRSGRQPTLNEIAKLTGVHVSTVSRVLRQQEPPDGWTDVALKIRRVAEQLGYRTNLMAASLRTRQTRTIGVVMSRLTDTVMASMYQAMEAAASTSGYQILLSSPPDSEHAQQESVDLLLSRQVDGIILASVHRPAKRLVDIVAGQRTPILLMNRHGDYVGRPAITCDDRRGGYVAARHLLDLGHRRIGIVAGPSHASTANDRVVGACEALREVGIDQPGELIVNSDFDVEGGLSAGQRLLTLRDRPSAIFAVSDVAAVAVMSVAREMGLTLPEDLSVVGYNDIALSSMLPIPLTTIRSPYVEMGRLSLERLLDLLAGRKIEPAVLPIELVRRASTTAWRGSRPRKRR